MEISLKPSERGDFSYGRFNFSHAPDSPAPTIMKNGKIYKQYFGSARSERSGHGDHIEGVIQKLKVAE